MKLYIFKYNWKKRWKFKEITIQDRIKKLRKFVKLKESRLKRVAKRIQENKKLNDKLVVDPRSFLWARKNILLTWNQNLEPCFFFNFSHKKNELENLVVYRVKFYVSATRHKCCTNRYLQNCVKRWSNLIMVFYCPLLFIIFQ